MHSFPPQTTSKTTAGRWKAGASFTIFASFTALTGCQTYQPSALDPGSHAAAWQQRGPADEKVRDFARRLAASAPRSVNFNPNDGLTVDEGELVALVYNPDLRLDRLKAGVAQATADHAGRWDDPTLNIDLLKVTQSVPSPWIVGSAISLTLPVSGRLAAEKSRAKAEHHAELARVAEEEWKTLRDLRKAWLGWSADWLRLEQTGHIIRSLESVVETTAKLSEAGELPRTESALFKIEHESRKADIVRLRGQLRESEQEIRSLMGISPTAPARFTPSLAASHIQRRVGSLPDTNPTLIRLQSEYEVAEFALLREIRKQYPDLELGPQFEREAGQSKIGVVGAIPLPIFNSNKGGIATARAARELARGTYETEMERTEGRLAAMRARLDGARARRQSIDSNVVPLVDRQIDDARKALEIGEGESLVLLESLVRAHEAKLSLIDARLEECDAQNEIRHLSGPATRGL